MKSLRTLLLTSLAVLCICFLIGYIRAVFTLYEPGHGIGLLGVPHVCAYRTWIPSFSAHGGVSLFLAGDTPEGTMPVFRFPSWPFAVGAISVLIYTGFALFVRKQQSRLG